jgi:hypothetical protein
MTERPVDPDLSRKLETSILGDTPLEFGETGSSLVESASYDPDQLMLRVTLKAGRTVKTYRYGGYPPSSWVEFYQAASKGSYFAHHIKSLYQGTPDA